MQMSHFREILIKQSPKYIPCNLKRCNVHVWTLNGYKVMPFWLLNGLFAQQQSYIILSHLNFILFS